MVRDLAVQLSCQLLLIFSSLMRNRRRAEMGVPFFAMVRDYNGLAEMGRRIRVSGSFLEVVVLES